MKPAVSISRRHGRRWRARSCSTRWSTAPATAGSIEGWQITLPLLARLRLKQQVAIPSTCTLSILQDVAPSCPEGVSVGRGEHKRKRKVLLNASGRPPRGTASYCKAPRSTDPYYKATRGTARRRTDLYCAAPLPAQPRAAQPLPTNPGRPLAGSQGYRVSRYSVVL